MKVVKIDGVEQSKICIDIGTGSIQLYLPKNDDGAARLVDWVNGTRSLSGHTEEENAVGGIDLSPVTLGAKLGPRSIVYGQPIAMSLFEVTGE